MPRRGYHFWVYILASRSRTLYVGMTNSIKRRTATHREGIAGTFSGRYAIHRLVYYEFFQYVSNAIRREKELKHWTREQKIELIERVNPTWEDLYPTLAEMATEMPTVGAVLERQAGEANGLPAGEAKATTPEAKTRRKADSLRE